jgi:hypothetical protein
METRLCQLFAYCETSGAPVGICSLEDAKAWRGTENEQTLYWDVIQSIGRTLLFQFDRTHRFFNTETGSFALYRSADGVELAIVEVIYMEEETTIPCNGLAFECDIDTKSVVEMKGWTCFFDSALTVPNTLSAYTSLHAVGQATPWNVAVLDCDYDTAYEVSLKSDTMLLQGICFSKESVLRTSDSSELNTAKQ